MVKPTTPGESAYFLTRCSHSVTSASGLLYTGSAHLLWEQCRAAVWVIFWSALVTFILMKVIGWVLRGARYKDDILEVGDLAIHDEEAFPEPTIAERIGGLAMAERASQPVASFSAAESPPGYSGSGSSVGVIPDDRPLGDSSPPGGSKPKSFATLGSRGAIHTVTRGQKRSRCRRFLPL